MSDSKDVKRAILELNVGKQVTVVLGRGGESSVFQGVLQQEEIPDKRITYWSILSDRGLVRQGTNTVAVPKTAIYFYTEQFGHLIVRQETEAEALEQIKLEQEMRKSSGLVNPNGQVLQ